MNLLHLEKSPYLKQHANNPVHWHAWNNETLLKARQEDKLLLVSIGYSTCHWCHVMEHESFENQEVAALMNAKFICIKVDREERPDVDDYYMDALHLMGQNGGWPLNCVALPNAKPVWGGTYFQKDKWMQILQQLAEIFENERERMEEYAVQLDNGLKQLNIISSSTNDVFLPKAETEIAWIKQLSAKFDEQFGGMDRAPKFPMPSIYGYLLRYYSFSGQQSVFTHCHFTLQKMASAGLFDQIGGGFARYSVDAQWFIPHFEKMLYDNGQLLSLYAEAYALEPNERFREIIDLTVAFINRELTSPQGAFYCGLDADSEGVEGKFYVWNWQEFEELFGNDSAKYQKYWSLSKSGNWEHGNNVLKVNENLSDLEIPTKAELDFARNKLLQNRELRIRPGLDDKVLVSWNCLAILGLFDAANALKEPLYAAMAQKSLDFIWSKMRDDKGNLFRVYHSGTLSVHAFLEDYALLISAFLKAFEFSQIEAHALAANTLCEIVLRDFAVKDSPLFYASATTQTGVNVRKVHYQDNVIPSANAIMAENLFKLGHLLLKPKYLTHSKNMLQTVFPFIAKDVEFFSHWAKLHNAMLGKFYEIVVTGPNAAEWMQEIQSWFLPNKVLVLAKENGTLEIAKFKFSNTENRVYLCEEGLCHSPITTLKDVEKAIWS